MRCIITGCAFVNTANFWLSGDLFESSDGTFVFNGNFIKDEAAWQSGAPFYNKHVSARDYWERRGVIVIEAKNIVLNIPALEYLGR
jgi:hypothetical protein